VHNQSIIQILVSIGKIAPYGLQNLPAGFFGHGADTINNIFLVGLITRPEKSYNNPGRIRSEFLSFPFYLKWLYAIQL